MSIKNVILKGYAWHEVKEILKSQHKNLTENDLSYKEGKEDELYQRLQQKLGKTKEEVDKIVETAQHALKEKHKKMQSK